MARVLVLSDLWPPFPGGAERLAFNLARDLLRRGHTVQVLTGYHEALEFDGPPVTSAPIPVFDNQPEGAVIVAGAIEAFRPDVVLTHHLYANQFHDTIAAAGVPFIHIVLNGARLPDAALGVFISRWVAAAGGAVPGDLTFIPPAFDDVVASTHGDAIGFIKPIEHKGVALLYRIAAALPDRQFLVLRGEWQNLEIIEPAPNIEFVEPVVDMRDFYARVRVMLMPSRSEDAGTVAQEATANGLPCISSNVDGLAETNAGGIQLDRDDLDGFVAAIRSLDDPAVYAARVAAQVAGLDFDKQARKLDSFAAALEAVASPGSVLDRLAEG